MRVERAHQRPGLTLRAQRRVHLEEGARAHPHHLPGNTGGQRVGLLPHEDDVDITDVIELARTAFAHRDNREPGWFLPLGNHQRHCHGQCGRQRGVGQIREVLTHHRERQHRFVLDGGRQIERGQHQEPVPVSVSQRRDRDELRDRRTSVDGADNLQKSLLQSLFGLQFDLTDQQLPPVGVRHQMITERQGRADHRQQPTPQCGIGTQLLIQRGPLGTHLLAQPDQREQRGIGVRGTR
ncbi:Uncharacterised protein [Mycobacteroides abscessus subsp. abscessus]|nr:Uncharacterised protein [Mycobacteroides abscessus subsp. abscessus]